MEQVNRSLRFKWQEASLTKIDSRADINLRVFGANGKVIEFLEYPRPHRDFSKIQKTEGLTVDEAVFMVKEENKVPPWLILEDAK